MLLPKPIVCLITPGLLTDQNFEAEAPLLLDVLQQAIAERVSIIQIREKQLSGKFLYNLAVSVVELTRVTSTRVLVNDRLDIALASGADGVHLASTSIPVEPVRQHTPNGFIISAAAHTVTECKTAFEAGADLALYAPVFATPGKGEPQGIEKLREVCEAVFPSPVLALGGIDQSNYREALAAGASGFAAIRCLNDPPQMQALMADIISYAPDTSK
jgi:thiamine-phosphate pyrophosphorylase